MKNVLILLLLLLVSCKEENTTKNTTNTPEVKTTSKIEVTQHKKYVTAQSGLNYRDQPNGKVLGKLNFNDSVFVVKHTNIFTEIKDDDKTFKGEWLGISLKRDTVYIFDAFLADTKSKVTDVWSKFPLRHTPLTDSTNFDNIVKTNLLNTTEINTLQLQKLYPDINKEGYEYQFYPSYQLQFGNFKSIVVNVFKGEHELESILIIYNQDNKLESIYQDGSKDPVPNATVIAYDEIAEGWSRTTSEIKNNCITTISALYTEPPAIDTTLHHINKSGEINKVNTILKNNIKPNTKLKINTIYTDTITFKAYNDDYDYRYLEGQKNNKNVALIYNWEWWSQPKYNFKVDNRLQITWKIDSTYAAGDGETLYFSEYLIDAKKIE